MNFSTDTQHLKFLSPVTALSFDFSKQFFEFPAILAATSLAKLRIRTASDRCVLTSLSASVLINQSNFLLCFWFYDTQLKTTLSSYPTLFGVLHKTK